MRHAFGRMGLSQVASATPPNAEPIVINGVPLPSPARGPSAPQLAFYEPVSFASLKAA